MSGTARGDDAPIPGLYTPAERDTVRAWVLDRARADARIVAGAQVGSLAVGPGDRWSDLDLTFGLAPGVSMDDVLADWTRAMDERFGAAHLFDLPWRSTCYRVFMLPNHLQVDLSFTPGEAFGPLGPKFALLFGRTVPRERSAPPVPAHEYGLGVHHAMRARISIERGRLHEAEWLIRTARDHALVLACLARDLPPRYARGYDALPADIRQASESALVRAIERDALLRALDAVIELLEMTSGNAGALKQRMEPQLRAFASGPLRSSGTT